MSKLGSSCRFIKKFLGAPSDSDVDTLRSENEKLKEQAEALQKKIGDLEREVGPLTHALSLRPHARNNKAATYLLTYYLFESSPLFH